MIKAEPMNVPAILLVPVHTEELKQTRKIYTDPNEVGKDMRLSVSFKTYLGTDKVVNGVLTVERTGKMMTYWRPDLKSDCHIYLPESQQEYEILGDPEDIDGRHQLIYLKVRSIGGRP